VTRAAVIARRRRLLAACAGDREQADAVERMLRAAGA
jgi:hypothetical protein